MIVFRTLSPLVPILATTALVHPAWGQPQGTVGEFSDVTIEGAVLQPEPITVSDDAKLASLITVPEGFEVTVVARGLGNARIMAIHDSGTLYKLQASIPAWTGPIAKG